MERIERGVPIRSVSRSIAALQAINRHGSLSLMEIARAIDLPYPTAYRIVQTLIYEGLIESEETRKRYRTASLAQSLSSGFMRNNRLVTIAHPYLVALTKKISWPTAIATHVGQWMMLADSTAHMTSLTFEHHHPGFTLPLVRSASGHIYLAYAKDEERECILKGLLEMDGPSQALSMFDSDKLIKRIRQDGFATSDRIPYYQVPYYQTARKTSAISVPIFEDDTIAGALTMTYFASAMSVAEAITRYADEVKQVASEISAALGKDRMVSEAKVEREQRQSGKSSAKPVRRVTRKVPMSAAFPAHPG